MPDWRKMQLSNHSKLFKWRRKAGGLSIALGGCWLAGGAGRGCAHDRHDFQGIKETGKDGNSGAGVGTIRQFESGSVFDVLHI
jgi:hypothetical protein